jgi:hypothetical protein
MLLYHFNRIKALGAGFYAVPAAGAGLRRHISVFLIQGQVRLGGLGDGTGQGIFYLVAFEMFPPWMSSSKPFCDSSELLDHLSDGGADLHLIAARAA